MEARNIIYPEFTGLYKVFDNGNILNTKTNRFLRPFIEAKPYNRVIVTLSNKGFKKVIGIAKLVADHFIEKPVSVLNTILTHKDGNHLNNNADNLVYLTSIERLKLRESNVKPKDLNKHYRKCYIINGNVRQDFESTKQLQSYLHIREKSFQRLVNSIKTCNGFYVRYV